MGGGYYHCYLLFHYLPLTLIPLYWVVYYYFYVKLIYNKLQKSSVLQDISITTNICPPRSSCVCLSILPLPPFPPHQGLVLLVSDYHMNRVTQL